MATNPWGKPVKKNPFSGAGAANNPSWVPGDDSFEDNAHQHPWRPGYVQYEDGSWGPPWSQRGGGGGYEDDSFEGNNARDPNRGRPGYVQAEDGSWVPRSFYGAEGLALDPNKAYPYHGKPIEW